MSRQACILILAAALPCAFGQKKQPDLVGTLTFDVGSATGRVETLAVQIGDGGSGRHKAILAGDSGLPTHAIYRPRELKPFGGKLLLPIVAFGNGGCRNTSGEFRNFLSDIASHGYIVLAIGPAGDALVGGSEGRVGQTAALQLLDGVDWITKENERAGSEYYKKIDTTKVAVMGQSCGTWQAMEVSGDKRVTTTVLLNGGGRMGLPRPAGDAPAAGVAPSPAGVPQAPGAYGNTSADPAPGAAAMMAALASIGKRYAPYAPAEPSPLAAMARSASQAAPVKFHGSVLYMPGGPSDMAFAGAVAGFEELADVPAVLAYQDVGHYPATYRQPHGGAFARAATAWLDWQLRGDPAAKRMFVGSPCGLCKDPSWTVKTKNVP